MTNFSGPYYEEHVWPCIGDGRTKAWFNWHERHERRVSRSDEAALDLIVEVSNSRAIRNVSLHSRWEPNSFARSVIAMIRFMANSKGRKHNAILHWDDVIRRHLFYRVAHSWMFSKQNKAIARSSVKADRSYWFAATAQVTRWNGIGALDSLDLSAVNQFLANQVADLTSLDEISAESLRHFKDVMIRTNLHLFQYNLDTMGLLERSKLDKGFPAPGASENIDSRTVINAEEFDFRSVFFEQAELHHFLRRVGIQRPAISLATWLAPRFFAASVDAVDIAAAMLGTDDRPRTPHFAVYLDRVAIGVASVRLLRGASQDQIVNEWRRRNRQQGLMNYAPRGQTRELDEALGSATGLVPSTFANRRRL